MIEQATAIDLISVERQRQVNQEGWTSEDDDKHESEQLARAAACYAMPKFWRVLSFMDRHWPWDTRWWKPTPQDRIRELVKAGALIVAEIERLQRLQD